MVDTARVDKFRKSWAKKTDDELVTEMHTWAAHLDEHLAAKLILFERHSKLERHRFHWIFWPALVAAVAGVVVALLTVIGWFVAK